MSLESEIRSNTVALDVMTQTLERLCKILESNASNSAPEITTAGDSINDKSEKVSNSTAKKTTENEKPDVVDKENPQEEELDTKLKKSEEELEKDSKENHRTRKELRDILNEYKNQVGIALARKLMPKLGYENSSLVPEDKLDEVFDIVYELVNGNDEEDEL